MSFSCNVPEATYCPGNIFLKMTQPASLGIACTGHPRPLHQLKGTQEGEQLKSEFMFCLLWVKAALRYISGKGAFFFIYFNIFF